MHVRRLWTGASFPLPRSPPIQAPLLSTMRREAHILELLDLLEAVQLRDPLNAAMTEAGKEDWKPKRLRHAVKRPVPENSSMQMRL